MPHEVLVSLLPLSVIHLSWVGKAESVAKIRHPRRRRRRRRRYACCCLRWTWWSATQRLSWLACYIDIRLCVAVKEEAETSLHGKKMIMMMAKQLRRRDAAKRMSVFSVGSWQNLSSQIPWLCSSSFERALTARNSNERSSKGKHIDCVQCGII